VERTRKNCGLDLRCRLSLDTLVDKNDTMIVNSDTSSTMIVNCDSASLLANDLGTMIINDTDDESTMRSKHVTPIYCLNQLSCFVVAPIYC